jgi:hypothetical protein
MALQILEGDEEGSLESEMMECGRGFHETQTRDCLRWRGPTAVVVGGPVLTSVGGPYQRSRDSLTVMEFWSWAPHGCFVQGRTDRLTVGRNMRLDSTSSCLRGNEYERKNGVTIGGGILYSVRLQFMGQGIAEWSYRVWRRLRITSLRVAKGDEKGTQCLGYNWATLFPGDINTGTWPPGGGVSNPRQ